MTQQSPTDPLVEALAKALRSLPRTAASSEAVLASATQAASLQEPWLTRAWRPACAFIILVILVFDQLLRPFLAALGYPVPTEATPPDQLWNLIGIYMGSRGVEKVAPVVLEAVKAWRTPQAAPGAPNATG